MSPRSKIATVYLLGFALDLANMFALNAAYPALQQTWHAPVAQLAWIGNAYMLGLTVVIPLGVWLARRYGERNVLMASLLLFGLGSAGAGSAHSIVSLLAWRLAQGLSGGLLIPVGQAMTYRAHPPAARAQLTTAVMMVALLVPALSPALGGWIVDRWTWRGVFFGMLPLTLVACGLARLWLPVDAAAEQAPALDLPGLALSATALSALLLSLTLASQPGSQAWAIAMLAIGLVAVIAYARQARRTTSPLLDLALLRHPLLRAGIVIYLCVPGVFTGVNLIAALYLQHGFDLSATEIGALMLPWAAASFAAIATTRRGFPTWGAKPLFAGGMLLQAIGILLLAAPCAAHPAGRVCAFAAMGFGASLCTSTAQSAAFLDVPAERMSDASALWNINRQLSFCLGTALLGSLLNLWLRPGTGDATLTPYRQCLLLAAAATLLPLPLILRLPARRTAPSPSLPH